MSPGFTCGIEEVVFLSPLQLFRRLETSPVLVGGTPFTPGFTCLISGDVYIFFPPSGLQVAELPPVSDDCCPPDPSHTTHYLKVFPGFTLQVPSFALHTLIGNKHFHQCYKSHHPQENMQEAKVRRALLTLPFTHREPPSFPLESCRNALFR